MKWIINQLIYLFLASLIRLASFCELNQLDEEVIRQNCVGCKRWWCTSMWIVHYWRGNCDNWLFLFIVFFIFLIYSWLELKKLKKLFLSERYYIGEICKLFLFVLTNCSIMFPIVINWRNIYFIMMRLLNICGVSIHESSFLEYGDAEIGHDWTYTNKFMWVFSQCFITPTSLASHLLLLGWLKLNQVLLLDQLGLA